MDKPRFTHDCKRCTFLGQFGEFDLYHCDQFQWSRIPTVIARYGNEPWEYASGLDATSIPELAEAKRRAEERGLNVKFCG